MNSILESAVSLPRREDRRLKLAFPSNSQGAVTTGNGEFRRPSMTTSGGTGGRRDLKNDFAVNGFAVIFCALCATSRLLCIFTHTIAGELATGKSLSDWDHWRAFILNSAVSLTTNLH